MPVLPKSEALRSEPPLRFSICSAATESYKLVIQHCCGLPTLVLLFSNVFGPVRAAWTDLASVDARTLHLCAERSLATGTRPTKPGRGLHLPRLDRPSLDRCGRPPTSTKALSSHNFGTRHAVHTQSAILTGRTGHALVGAAHTSVRCTHVRHAALLRTLPGLFASLPTAPRWSAARNRTSIDWPRAASRPTARDIALWASPTGGVIRNQDSKIYCN